MTLSETLRYSGLVAERYELASVAEKLFGTKQLDVTAGTDQGWSGVGLPEELGGSGGDEADLAPILEAAGSTCAAAPLTWSTGVVGQLFSHDADLVSAISSGADVALPLASAEKLAAEITLEDGRLRGEFLVIGTGSHGVLVPFESDGAPCAAVLTDVPVENLPGLDQTRPWGRVRLDGVSTSGMAVVSAPDLFSRWETKMAQAFALDAAGAARSALRRTIEYSLTREQFG
ncbi:MAG TPA: hypothetical protein VNZ66_02620, partial [Aeromicrobium sp.]|nr:hypothetical protein [Aeromicrobium sp.]